MPNEMPLAQHGFENELEVAIKAAQEAGKLLKSHFDSNSFAVVDKNQAGENQGLVTQADIEAEDLIKKIISSHFPEHAFLAEESDPQTGDELWVIDPLDGTNNFAHLIPHFAVSIAYCVQEVTKVGVVLDPIRNDLFVAVEGQGAYHNDRRASVNSQTNLDQTMLAVGFYYDRSEMMRRTLATIDLLFQQNIHGIRRMGTAALDIVQVGLGRFGGYFEYTLSPWDFAAARLFVEEAGGKITDCEGKPLQLKKTSVLAANPYIHEKMLTLVRQ